MKPLSNVELKSLAPSIFATSPSFEVSEKYAFIPTIEVVEMFRNSSWYPVESKESFVRLTHNQGYQKHLIRFRHIGFKEVAVKEAIERIVANTDKINEKINLYKQIELNHTEQLSLTRAAKDIRFKPYQEVDIYTLIQSHRKEDNGNDLWRVFNRLQENAIRGGVKGKNIITNRNFTSKPIKSIDSLISINEKLFDLTERFASIKLSA